MKIKSPKDFWSGLMFLGVGLFFVVWAAVFYNMGTAVRMGPAYFPVLLVSLAADGPPVPKFHYRPLLLISLGCVAYGYLMKPLGLILATVALVFISALGGHEFKWKEVLILSVILVLFSVLVFVKGLTLPFPICPQFIETCPIR